MKNRKIMRLDCVIISVLAMVFAPAGLFAADIPHYSGAAWERGVVRVVIEAGAYRSEVIEAMSNWNAVLAPYGVRLVAGKRTRKNAMPVTGDRESTIFLSNATPNYADVRIRRRGRFIVEGDVRISDERFAKLTPDRRRIIIEHELGHFLGFGHYDGPELSVLHSRLPPSIRGVTEFDRQSISQTYGGKKR